MLPAQRYVGIFNQGSTCYLSSVIQTLFHLPIFRTKIYNLRPPADSTVFTALRNLFILLEMGSKTITTTELTNAFGWDAQEAAIQHDSHELVQKLLDSIEALVKGTSEETFVRDLFGGLQIYRSKAVDVDYVSDRLEGFYDIELIVQDKKDMTQSLDAYVHPETIEGVSIEVTPKAPATKHNIERSQHLLRLPPVLFIHPNRVGFDMETFETTTLRNIWEFPLESLDLAKYMTDTTKLKLDKESKEKMKTLGSTDLSLPCGTEYELQSVLIHAGDANIGHYYCYVRFGDEWVRFNDELVDASTEEELKKAAYGGDSEYRRYRPFSTERASLLVYVNKQCKGAVLEEIPAPPALLEAVHRQEEEKRARLSSKGFNFFVGNHAFIDVLDQVRGEFEKQLVEVRYDSTAADVRASLLNAVAKHMKVSVESLRQRVVDIPYRQGRRFNVYTVPPRTSAAASADDHDIFVYFREMPAPGRCGAPAILYSVEDLTKILRPKWNLYAYTSTPPCATCITRQDQLYDGANIISAPPEITADHIVEYLGKRQFVPVRVHCNDPKNPGKTIYQFTLTVSSHTKYSELQSRIYQAICENRLDTGGTPASERHIALCYPDEEDVIVPPTVEHNGVTKEYSLSMLWSRESEHRLCYSVVPLSLQDINYEAIIIFRFGWNNLPRVYLSASQKIVKFGDILEAAVQQLADRMPEQLLKRYRNRAKLGPMARLLKVKKSTIYEVYANESDYLNFSSHGYTFVVDPLPPAMSGYKVVDVLCCSRRSGEEYFGYPTNVNISDSLAETGNTIVQRIMKKLQVPDPDSLIKKCSLSVKGLNSRKIKLCEPKDVLAKIVKELGEDTFEFLIDRPEMCELDGIPTLNPRREEKSIVIKSTSHPDMSSL